MGEVTKAVGRSGWRQEGTHTAPGIEIMPGRGDLQNKGLGVELSPKEPLSLLGWEAMAGMSGFVSYVLNGVCAELCCESYITGVKGHIWISSWGPSGHVSWEFYVMICISSQLCIDDLLLQLKIDHGNSVYTPGMTHSQLPASHSARILF